jgi:hypothetical protein
MRMMLRGPRAGLELVRAVGDLKIHAPLQTLVGIATGLVVVGDLIGSGASREQASGTLVGRSSLFGALSNTTLLLTSDFFTEKDFLMRRAL